MRNTIIIISLLSSIGFFAQKLNKKDLIDLDSTWGKEIFEFPISFAPSLNYKGFEEARFPPEGWNSEKHDLFWSYTFAWSIRETKKITKKQLETDLETYFDGLNRVPNNKNLQQYKASVFLKTQQQNKTTKTYKGLIKTFDRFTTKKAIILNTIIEVYYCNDNEKILILFKFSPKDFNQKTWSILKEIKPISKFCN